MGARPKKKKGPKGKKARAKAKLEQVWGEHVDEDARKASQIRTGGKSRLRNDAESGGKKPMKKVKEVDPVRENRRGVATPFDKFLERKEGYNNQKYGSGQQRSKRRNQRVVPSDDSSDDDGEDSDDEMNDVTGTGGSFATLLNRINGPNKSSRKMAIDSDDDLDESDEDSSSESDASSSEDSESDAEMQDSDNNESEGDNLQDKGSNGQSGPKAADPYDEHFSKPMLPQLDSLQSTSLVPHTGNNRKVSTKALLNSSVDVQMSGPILDCWDDTTNALENGASVQNGMKSPKKKQGNTRKNWEALAAGPYQHVRQVLSRNWKSVNRSALKRSSAAGDGAEESNGSDEHAGGSVGKVFSSLQLAMYPAVSRYADVMVSSETRQNHDEISNLLSMHILNHVLTSRTRVQRHNRRIKELTNNDDSDENSPGKEQLPDDEEGGDKWRDQGYTRPKVLVLFPTRGTCWKFVQQMMKLLGDSAIVEKSERFDEEFGPSELGGGDGSDDEDDAGAEARRAAVLKQKGAEWNELFGDEINNDDDFKIGMSLTPNVVKSSGKKKSKHAGTGASGVNMKLFAEFYRSDIILASPIGLKMATTNNDGDEEEEEADVDFLSSIDICIVARSDVLLMQNWDHVNSILDSLNRQPKKITDIDFSRVRNYFLEGQGAHWRQLIMVSKFTDPYIQSTFRRHAKNVEGQLRMRRKVSNEDASICDVMVRVKQVFQRVSCNNVAEAGINRLRYFSEHIMPKLLRLKQKHTLIYIPSYFDFIAVRNLLLKHEADFVSVTEYARVSEVSRGRARFLQGRKPIMLYTGRANFFLRHKIKGARHVIFFGLPEYAEVYPAIVNMMNEGLSNVEDGDDDITRMPMSCLSLFTKFDAHQLERVVGTSHTERMIKGSKFSFMFCS